MKRKNLFLWPNTCWPFELLPDIRLRPAWGPLAELVNGQLTGQEGQILLAIEEDSERERRRKRRRRA